MKLEKTTAQRLSSAEKQLTVLISKLEPSTQKILKSLRKGLKKRFPSLNELVYDYGKSVVISWSPNERGADGVVALSADGEGVRLVFTHGVSLPDPNKILLGKATQIRYIRPESAKDLLRPEVEALMSAAVKKAGAMLSATGRGELIIKDLGKKKGGIKK